MEPLQSASIFKIVPENLLLVNMRPVEGENAVMLQLREIGGKPATFSVASDKINFVKTTVCDVVGDPVSGNPLSFAPWDNMFIKLSWLHGKGRALPALIQFVLCLYIECFDRS